MLCGSIRTSPLLGEKLRASAPCFLGHTKAILPAATAAARACRLLQT